MEKSKGDVDIGSSSSSRRDWKDLDRDVLTSIFKRLRRKDLVKGGAPLCCTSWYSASKDPSLWKVVNLRFWEPNKGSDDWWKEDHPVTQILDFVINRSQGLLTIIKLPRRSSVDDLLYVAERCPRLTYFDLKIHQNKVKLVEGKKTFDLSISKLKELDGMAVDEVFISDDSTLQQIKQCCPKFKQLKVYLHEEDDLLSKNTISLITTYFPKLKELYLPGTGLHRQDVLLILDACDELEILDITCNGKICVKDEILKKGSCLKEFYWENEVSELCYDCEGEHLEVDVQETYSYRWPCPHVLEEGFDTYISGTKEFLCSLYPNSGATFGELVGNLYPNAKGRFVYPAPPAPWNPFLLESYDLPMEYHENYDMYCNCGFSSDSDDGGTGDAAFITEAYSL